MEQLRLFPKRELYETNPTAHILSTILAQVEEYINTVRIYNNSEDYVDIAPKALLGEFVRFLLITQDLIE